MTWKYGDTVLYRYGRQGQARFVRVGRVIVDDAAGLTLWIGPGSVWWFFDEAGRFEGWYGNLESPRVRWESCAARYVDTADRALDVWVPPDRVARWKDEDEFAVLTGQTGRWTAEQAPGIRAAGEHLMTLAAAGAPPFDGQWTDYRPAPAWTAPETPADWDLPHRAHP